MHEDLPLLQHDGLAKATDVGASTLILAVPAQHEGPRDVAPVVVHLDAQMLRLAGQHLVVQEVRLLPTPGLELGGGHLVAVDRTNDGHDVLHDAIHGLLHKAGHLPTGQVHLGVRVKRPPRLLIGIGKGRLPHVVVGHGPDLVAHFGRDGIDDEHLAVVVDHGDAAAVDGDDAGIVGRG